MPWLASHQELGRHPKTKRLARALGISLPAAIGHLHLLWWWALDFAPDGVLDRYDATDLADAALWVDDPLGFVAALVTAGFIDSDGDALELHDWDDYAGKWIERRAKDRLRKKDSGAGRLRQEARRESAAQVFERDGWRCLTCGAADDLTLDHILALSRGGTNDADNLQTLCRSCNSRKGAG